MNAVYWPNVFTEPVDAPYQPDFSSLIRRGSAIADALMGLGNRFAGYNLPPDFNRIVEKLQRIGGFKSFTLEDLIAAKEAWLVEVTKTR